MAPRKETPEGEVYGGCLPLSPKERRELESLIVKLQGNPTVATRLRSALNLQDDPGHPGAVDMSLVRIFADMFQAGFANMEYVNPRPLTAINIGNTLTKVGYFAGPNALPVPGDPGASVFNEQNSSVLGVSAFPMYRNQNKDMRVSNAWVKWLPTAATLNPNTDTNPHSIHCEFLIDGNIIWEQIQNNLVASAADWSFMSQTGDTYWNGIVPAGAVFSFKFYITDGKTGLPVGTINADGLQAGLIALAVPAGAQLPR